MTTSLCLCTFHFSASGGVLNSPRTWVRGPGTSGPISVMRFSLSTNTMVGRNVATSDSGTSANAAMITRSPGPARCAAAPLTQIARDRFLTEDGIGLEPCATGDIPDVDRFVFGDAGELEKVGRDGDASFVMEVGFGDGGPVDLGPEHSAICFVHQPLNTPPFRRQFPVTPPASRLRAVRQGS